MTYALSLLLLATLPFQFALSIGSGVDIPGARLLAAVILLSFLLEAFLFRKWQVPSALFMGAFLSLMGIAGFSVLWAVRPELAIPKIAFILNLFPLTLVWYSLIKNYHSRFIILVRATVLGATMVALLGIAIFVAQFVFGVGPVFHFLVDQVLPFFLGHDLGTLVARYPSLLVNINGATVLRVTAVFPDPHVASYFFGLTGFLALGLARASNRSMYAWAAALLWLADILTFSRGGYLGLIAGFGVYIALVMSDMNQRSKVTFWSLSVVFLLTAALFGGPVTSRFLSSFSLQDTSSLERLSLWRETTLVIADHPVLGVGLGNYLSIARPLAEVGTPFYAHNLYLDTAVELGYLGLAMLLLTLLFVFSVSARARRHDPFAATIAAALALYLTHSIFETTLFSLHVTILLGLILALGLTLKRREISST